MYFTGTPSSTTESILSSNTTDELNSEFLESVGILFENYLSGYEEDHNTFMVGFFRSDVRYFYGISVL